MSRALVCLAAVGVVLLGGVASAETATDEWILYGTASGDLSDGGSVVLTENERYQAGIVLRNAPTSLASPITFRYRLEHTGGTERADGSAFILLNDRGSLPQEPLPEGGHLGISGLDGIAVVFDTWQNDAPANDPAENFIGVVDMSKGLWDSWLITSADSVWRDAVDSRGAMDVFITVDRPAGVLQVGLAYDAQGAFADRPDVTWRFSLGWDYTTDADSKNHGYLSESVRIGFAAASGSTAGGHTIVRYEGAKRSPAVNSGLSRDINELGADSSLPLCPDDSTIRKAGGSAERSRVQTQGTNFGAPVHSPNLTVEQRSTVYIVTSWCTYSDDHQGERESAVLGRCSGVLISPNVVLTADHCISGNVPLHSGYAYVGLRREPASGPLTTYMAPPVSRCRLGRVLWSARAMEPGDPVSQTTTRDLAAVSLTDCTEPDALTALGGVPIDTGAFERLEREGRMAVTYLGYPGDRPQTHEIPTGFDQARFPELWQVDLTGAEIGFSDDDDEDGHCWPIHSGCREVLWMNGAGISGGGSGGAIFGPSLEAGSTRSGDPVRPVVSLAAVSMHDRPNLLLGLYTKGPFITEAICRDLWAAVVREGLQTPICLGLARAPSAPARVWGQARRGSALVSWDAVAGDRGPVTYTVRSSPGSRTCSTTVTSCIVTGLVNGIDYTFTVTAASAAGESPASTASSSVRPIGLPGGVRNLSARWTKPGSVVRVTWSPPRDWGGSPEMSYQVRVNKGPWRKRSMTTILVNTDKGLTVSVRAISQTPGGAGPITTIKSGPPLR